MPGSEAADGPRGGELEALEQAVTRLVERYAGLRDRVAEAERSRERLEETLAETGGEDGAPPASERLESLGRENRRLRETIEEARAHAERIRSRLIMMEDEVAS